MLENIFCSISEASHISLLIVHFALFQRDTGVTECINIGCAAAITYIILGGLDVVQIFFMLNFESVLSYVHEWQPQWQLKLHLLCSPYFLSKRLEDEWLAVELYRAGLLVKIPVLNLLTAWFNRVGSLPSDMQKHSGLVEFDYLLNSQYH